MRSRAPLKALQRVRRERVDVQERHLAQEVRQAHLAAEGVRAAEGELTQKRKAMDGTLAVEAEWLAGGQSRAVDLERNADFEREQRARLAEQASRVERARRAEQQALATKERAEKELALAEAEAKALDRHCARVEQARAREAEHRAEEAVADVFNHRFRRGRC